MFRHVHIPDEALENGFITATDVAPVRVLERKLLSVDRPDPIALLIWILTSVAPFGGPNSERRAKFDKRSCFTGMLVENKHPDE